MDNLNVANAASAISAMLPLEDGDQQDVEMQEELTQVDSAAPEEELQDGHAALLPGRGEVAGSLTPAPAGGKGLCL